MNLDNLLRELDSRMPFPLRRFEEFYAIGSEELALGDGVSRVEKSYSVVSLFPLKANEPGEFGDLTLAIETIRDHFWLEGIGVRLSGPLFALRIHDALDPGGAVLPDIEELANRLGGFWTRGANSNSVVAVLLNTGRPLQGGFALYREHTIEILLDTLWPITGAPIGDTARMFGPSGADQLDWFKTQLIWSSDQAEQGCESRLPARIFVEEDRSDGETGTASEPGNGQLTRPAIDLNAQLREIMAQTNRAVLDANEGLLRSDDAGALYEHEGSLSRVAVQRNCGGARIQRITPSLYLLYMTRSADYFRVRITEDGEVRTPAHPDMAAGQALLALPAEELGFPHLEDVSFAPQYRPDFSLITHPGYDVASGLYYVVPPELEAFRIPPGLGKDAAVSAGEFLKAPVAEFPWVDQASLANYLGSLLTLSVSHVVGKSPAYCVRANQQSCGKTLLCQSIAIIQEGSEVPVNTAPRPNSEEWGKLLFSLHLRGRSIILFDNCIHKFESEVLAQNLTADLMESRRLRTNDVETTSTRAFVMANGNQLVVGADMRRRCFWTLLEALTAKSHHHRAFTYDPVLSWVKNNRRQLLEAIFTMIESWLAAGRPVPDSVIRLPSFESWCTVVGGILEYAGIPGFLANFDQMFDEADPGEAQWEHFLATLYSGFRDAPITSRHLLDTIKMQPVVRDALPDDLVEAVRKESPQILGMELRKVAGRRYGDSGLRIVQLKESRTKVWLWRVTRDTPASASG